MHLSLLPQISPPALSGWTTLRADRRPHWPAAFPRVGNMSFMASGETPLRSLERETALVRAQAIADVFLHPVLTSISDEVVGEVAHLPDAAAPGSSFSCCSRDFDAHAPGYVGPPG